MKNNLEELLEYRMRLKTALTISEICIFEVDIQQQLYTYFENSQAIFGIPGKKILRDVQPFSRLPAAEYQAAVSKYFVHPDDWEVVDNCLSKIFAGKAISYHARMKAGDSNFKWCRVDVAPILSEGIPVKMIGVITDIHEMKLKLELSEKKAHFDDFTGLYNKKYTEIKIQELLEKQPNGHHAFLFFDLDHFKRINDSYGHEIGDQILYDTAQQLKDFFPKEVVLGRFGGDEFIVFIPNYPNFSSLKEQLNELLGHSSVYPVTKSIGVSLFPEDGNNYAELFQKADAAMYRAKQKNNCYTFSCEPS